MNELLIYSDIGENWMGDGVSAKSIKDQLDGFSGALDVRINSGGGDVFDGFAIYNLISQYEGETTVYIDGLAASAASVIAMAGDNIVMSENALMMIHDPWTMTVGAADDIRKTADLLDKVKSSIVTTYHTQTGIDSDEISAMMSAETWLTADESIERGFATATAESRLSISNISKPWIKNGPKPEKIKDDLESQISWRLALNKRRFALLD